MNILSEIKALSLPPGQYIVAGSAIMVMHGLKETHDIDIVVSKEQFDRSASEGWKKVPYTYEDKLGEAYLRKGFVELYLDVNHGEAFRPSLEELLSRAEYFEGIPFLSLGDLLKFKRSYDRPKDRIDIALIERFIGDRA